MENHLIVRQGRDFGDLALWMKSVLVAENLWGTIDPSVKDNESSYGLQEKEEKALQVIHNYCSGRALFAIAKEKKPRCAWKKLAEFYYKESFDARDEELKYVGIEQLTEAVERKNWEFVEKLLAYWPDLTISMEQHLQVSFLKLLSCRDWENARRLLTCYPPLKTSLEETFGEFVRGGDWEAIENSVIRHPHLGTIKVTSRDETALHVAVHGGKERIVNCLVEQMEDLKGVDVDGYSALAMAVIHGKSSMVECMLRKDSTLIEFETNRKRIPVVLAIEYKHEKMVGYLYDRTPLEYLIDHQGIHGATVCSRAIYNGMLEVALDLIERHQPLVLKRDVDGRSPLYALASTPDAFLHVKRPKLVVQSNCLDVFHHPVLINIEKESFELAHSLLDCMCSEILKSNAERRGTGCFSDSIHVAIREGTFDFVSKILKKGGVVEWPLDSDGRSILSYAVLHRQAKIFREILKSPTRDKMINSVDKHQHNVLHVAGMFGPKSKIDGITSPALQMQSQVRCYKEVESIVLRTMIRATNKDGLTPQDLFTINHMDLRKKGKESMMSAASSYTMVVSILWSAMLAVIISVPGGYNEMGLPNFWGKKAYMVSSVGNNLSCLFSFISLMALLGVQTSRYAETDFLVSLPIMMITGLVAFVFSILTALVAFLALVVIFSSGQLWLMYTSICSAIVLFVFFVRMMFVPFIALCKATWGSDWM